MQLFHTQHTIQMKSKMGNILNYSDESKKIVKENAVNNNSNRKFYFKIFNKIIARQRKMSQNKIEDFLKTYTKN